MIQRSTHLAITSLSYGGSQQQQKDFISLKEWNQDIVLICERVIVSLIVDTFSRDETSPIVATESEHKPGQCAHSPLPGQLVL